MKVHSQQMMQLRVLAGRNSIVMLGSYDNNSMACAKGVHIHKESLQTSYTPITLHSTACYQGMLVTL